MSRKTEKGKAVLAEWLVKNGWKLNAWGNYHKVAPNGIHLRVVRGKIGLRLEKRLTYLYNKPQWKRVASGYYRDLSIGPDGKLEGLKR